MMNDHATSAHPAESPERTLPPATPAPPRTAGSLPARLATLNVLIALVFLAGIAALEAGVLVREAVLTPPFTRGTGHLHEARPTFGNPLPRLLHARSDSNDAPRASRLELFDRVGLLGPAHAQHQDIRDVGDGAYSHWRGSVLFSTRGNADPAVDQGLRVRAPLVARPWVQFAAASYVVAAVLLLAYALRHRLPLQRIGALRDGRQIAAGPVPRTRPEVAQPGIAGAPTGRQTGPSDRPTGFFIFQMIAAVLGLAALLAVEGGALSWTTPLGGSFAREGAHGYATQQPLANPAPWLFRIASDRDRPVGGAGLTLYDAAGPLGPGGAQHQHIRDLGDGRYSHWGQTVLFSLRDNGDPNVANPQLKAKYPLRPRLWVYAVAAAVLILAFLNARGECAQMVNRLRRSRATAGAVRLLVGGRHSATRLIVLTAIPFYALVLLQFPYNVVVQPDTGSYYAFTDIRTAGYPLFLHVWLAIFGNPYWIVVTQVAAAAVAVVALVYAIEARCRRSIEAYAVGALLLAKDGLVFLHYYLGPDSLTFTFGTLILAVAILLSDERASFRMLLLLLALFFVGILIRPAVFAYAPALALVAVRWITTRPLWVGVLVLGLLVSLNANRIVAPAVRAAYDLPPRAVAGELMGISLMGSAGLLMSPEVRSEHPALMDDLVEAFSDIRTSYWSNPDLRERFLLLNDNFNLNIGVRAGPIVNRHLPTLPGETYNSLMKKTSLEAMRAHPADVLRLSIDKFVGGVYLHFTGAWRYPYLRESFDYMLGYHAFYRDWVETYGFETPGPVTFMAPDPLGVKSWLHMQRPTTNLLLAAACAAFPAWWLLALWRRRALSPAAGAATAASLGLLGYHGMICLISLPIGRYYDPASAYSTLVLVLAAGMGARAVAARVGTLLPPRPAVAGNPHPTDPRP